VKTLILAADWSDADRAARRAGLDRRDCTPVFGVSDLRGRETGGQPRIITDHFRREPGAEDALKLCDLFPARGEA